MVCDYLSWSNSSIWPWLGQKYHLWYYTISMILPSRHLRKIVTHSKCHNPGLCDTIAVIYGVLQTLSEPLSCHFLCINATPWPYLGLIGAHNVLYLQPFQSMHRSIENHGLSRLEPIKEPVQMFMKYIFFQQGLVILNLYIFVRVSWHGPA